MNIVYHLTDNYARISGTSIVSVFENNRDVDEINIYLIENGFSKKTKDKFTFLANKYGRKVFFIPLPDVNGGEYDLGLVRIKKNWVFDSYSRLFLDYLLPDNVARVIYVDGDTLVLGSLNELWNMELGGKCCAACMDCVSKPYYTLFGIDENNRYCNSGLILIDLQAWKEKNIAERVKAYVKKNNGYVFFMEQTVFNVILQNETVCLPLEYNVSSLIQVFSYNELIQLRKPIHFYTAEEVEIAQKNPIVVHMTGFFYVINRAWNEVTNHPDRNRFIQYSTLLGWEGEILQKDKRNIRTRIKDEIIHRMPKRLLLDIVSLLYNSWRIRNIKRTSDHYKRNKIT